MTGRRQKRLILGIGGSLAGVAMLLLFHSIPVAAGSGIIAILAVIILKHLALAIITGSPLLAIVPDLKSKIRSRCPFAGS